MREKVVIIGGGVTGLAAAGFLGGTHDCVLLERESELGGYCRTFYQDGFTWDYSGHFFHFRNKWVADYVHARLDVENLLKVQKETRIFFRGQFVDFPFQHNIHQLPMEDFLRCLSEMYEAQADTSVKKFSNFKEMLYGRYGKSLSDMFLIPYNEKLYAIDADKLDPDSMGRFFPHVEFGELLKSLAQNAGYESYNDNFAYHRRGAQAYVEALASYVPGGVIRTETSCDRIDLDKQVVHAGGEEIPYDRLIATSPLPRILGMAGLDEQPDVFSANKVLVFNLGFDKPSTRPEHWTYYPEADWVFFRIGRYDRIFGEDRMSLYVEIGLPADAPVDEAAYLERTLEDLRRVGVVDDHNLISHVSVVLDPAYVHISEAANTAAAKAFKHLAAHGVYPAGRYGQWVYCSIEDNILQAYELAKSWGGASHVKAA
jgi:protoporphyrinogen oxidase